MRNASPIEPVSLDCLERQARRQYDGSHFQAAIEKFDEVVTRMEEDLGPDHPRTLANRNNLARARR